MPRTETYTMNSQGIEALKAQGSMFNGRSYRVTNETTVDYYAGNSDHDKMARFAARFPVKSVASPAAPIAAPLATPRQIAFLRSLIEADYGTATTVGARITADLTKAEASRMIDMMKNA